MSNLYIKSLPVNLFSGVFNATLEFSNGLNILSGVNGTGKTQVLGLLKNNQGVVSEVNRNSEELNIFAITPKRNAENKVLEVLLQDYRTQNKNIQKLLEQIRNFQIKTDGFETYPSFAELFIQSYESAMHDTDLGYGPAVKQAEEEFNLVLKRVFPEYEIHATWDPSLSPSLDLKVSKYGHQPILIERLSTGEREVFALLFAIFMTRDKEDVYLIDEPEIHLNWDLEKALFDFFEWFCEEFQKQIIVVTHSRIIFRPEYYAKTQFLLWEKGRVEPRKEITDEQKASIAGEIAQVIHTIAPQSLTFFVEDRVHAYIVKLLMKAINKEVLIVECGNKEAVKSVYRMLKSSNSNKAFFLVDGDNEGSAIKDNCFITLSRYCLINYFLEPAILGSIFGKTEAEILSLIHGIVRSLSSDKHLLVYKRLAELLTTFPVEVLDTLDGGKVFKPLSNKLGMPENEVIERFITECSQRNQLDTIFGEILIKLKS